MLCKQSPTPTRFDGHLFLVEFTHPIGQPDSLAICLAQCLICAETERAKTKMTEQGHPAHFGIVNAALLLFCCSFHSELKQNHSKFITHARRLLD